MGRDEKWGGAASVCARGVVSRGSFNTLAVRELYTHAHDRYSLTYFLPRSSAALIRRVPAGSSATDDSSTSDIDDPTGLYSPDAVARRSITEYSALSSCSRNVGYEM